MTSYTNNQIKYFTTPTSHFFKMKQMKISSINIQSSWKKYQPNQEENGSNKQTHYTNLILVVDKSL